MNICSLYNLSFQNKKVNEWYNRLFVRVVNLFLPAYYYVSGFFLNRKLKESSDLNSPDKYIISLTSFPVRINTLWLVIESLLRQKEKPDAIMLWLYKEDFDGKSSLPKSLLRFEKWIQIKFCDENLKPHIKYFYTMKKYPEANIITVDDDVIYPSDLIRNLKKSHKKHPNSICSTTTRTIKINKGTIQSYSEWKKPVGPLKKSHQLQQLGVGGVLYPRDSLHKEVFNINALKQMALKADDLWLKVMSSKNNTAVVSLSNARHLKLLPVIIKNDNRLMESNIIEGQNDKVLKDIMNYYGLSSSIFKDDSGPNTKKKNHFDVYN